MKVKERVIYNISTIFLLVPDASWISIKTIESRVQVRCLKQARDVSIDTFFIGIPLAGKKAISFNPEARDKDIFLNKLNNLLLKPDKI